MSLIYDEAVQSEFTALDYESLDLDYVYVSRSKLEQLLLPTEVPGGGATVAGTGGSKDTRTRETRELLRDAGRHFAELGTLSYELAPRKNSWLLVRAIMTCGTAWPWAGSMGSPAKRTAWWVGSSQSLRILAYGNRDHLLGHGKVPAPGNEDSPATWWPSRADGYLHLLNAISASVITDNYRIPPEVGGDDEFANGLEGLENYFFSNAGVQRGDSLQQRGVFEMMLRVDNVVDVNGVTTVAGSPLWVARVPQAVPGTYEIEPSSGRRPRTEVLGDWDGLEWRAIEKRTYPSDIEHLSGAKVLVESIPLTDPLLALAPPSIESIVSLAPLAEQKPITITQKGRQCFRCWAKRIFHRNGPVNSLQCRKHAE